MESTPASPSDRIRIAVDGMGGDDAPAAIVAGAIEAADIYGDRLAPVLVGREDRLREEIRRAGGESLNLEIVHANQEIGMEESGAGSYRKKRDSSLAVATRLVRERRVDGVFSAGNTGAMVAASLLNIGRIPGVNRPALATLIPTSGSPAWAIMLDAGATADCKPLNLFQFAVLGEVYARILLDTERPRVGLLNIGEESSKGNELAQESHELLKKRANFVGNVEGRDVLAGKTDVVVTDGFTGNVMLKFAESVWAWTLSMVKAEVGEHVLAKVGGLLLKPSLKRLKDRMDYSEYGGAPLLGVNGISIIGHGRSNAKAVRNGIRFAVDLVESGLMEEIRAELERDQGGKVVNS